MFSATTFFLEGQIPHERNWKNHLSFDKNMAAIMIQIVLLVSLLSMSTGQDCGYCLNCHRERTDQVFFTALTMKSILARVSRIEYHYSVG